MTIIAGGIFVGGVAVVGTVGKLCYDSISDWLGHHPSDSAKTLSGTTVVIQEKAENWNAHKIRLTIVWSPDDKVTGATAVKHTWHAHSSREHCLNELEQKVIAAYGNH